MSNYKTKDKEMKAKSIDFLTRSLGVALVALMISGCSSKEAKQEYNKSADYWYQKVGESVAKGDLESADGYFVSLRSEHGRSAFVPTATLMLAHAHMDAEEYLLAGYFFDEYLKRFGDSSTVESIEFKKLKASFLGIKELYKDQKLIMDTTNDAQTYLMRYPDSRYVPLVQTILLRLHMSDYLMNENIAALYERTGKEDAAKIYREKNNNSPLKLGDIEPPKVGFIGKIFN